MTRDQNRTAIRIDAVRPGDFRVGLRVKQFAVGSIERNDATRSWPILPSHGAGLVPLTLDEILLGFGVGAPASVGS